jgi:hypothetical protein
MDQRDRPDDEIEVTPEMLAAGRLAMLSFDGRFERHEDAAERVFWAMLEAGGFSLTRNT